MKTVRWGIYLLVLLFSGFLIQAQFVTDVFAAKDEAEKAAQAEAKAAAQAEKAAEKAAQQAAKQAEKAAEQAAKQAEKMAEQAAKAEAKAAAQAEKAAEKAAAQAEKAAEKAAEQAAKQAEKMAAQAAKAEAKAAAQAEKAAQQAAQAAAQQAAEAAAQQASQVAAQAAEQAVQQVVEQVQQQVEQIAVQAAENAIEQIQAEVVAAAIENNVSQQVSQQVIDVVEQINTESVSSIVAASNAVEFTPEVQRVLESTENKLDSLSPKVQLFLLNRVEAKAANDNTLNPKIELSNGGLSEEDKVRFDQRKQEMVLELLKLPSGFIQVADKMSEQELAELSTAGVGDSSGVVREVEDLYGEDGEGMLFVEVTKPVKTDKESLENEKPQPPIYISNDMARRTRKNDDGSISLEG